MDWPKDERGLPEPAAELTAEPDRGKFFAAKAFLESMGIPVLERLNGETPFSPVLFGDGMRGGRLYVPQSLLGDATALLSEPSGSDGIDIGEPE
jgi:hypothetical protein